MCFVLEVFHPGHLSCALTFMQPVVVFLASVCVSDAIWLVMATVVE